jgi:acyl-CoA reductase-like NAD-dependent aldehyde dehydrogenase
MEILSLKIKNAKATNQFKDIKSPYSGELIAKMEIADDTAIDQALSNSCEYYEQIMSQMPAHKRAEILNNVAKQVKENLEELSMCIALEGGKPLTDARAEVIRAVNTFETCANAALSVHGEEIRMDRTPKGENHIAFTIKQSIGPVLAISAFNHPVNLIAHQLGCAFAAGNTILLKPASTTPISAYKIVQFFENAGLDSGVISFLSISGSQADKIISDKRIKYINFIGSSKVGWGIRRKAHNGTRMAFEHGGTAVCTVDKFANLDKAISKIVKHGYYHAGQVCVSTQNVFVHSSLYDEFLQGLIGETQKLKTGDPTNSTTDVGPLITQDEVARVEEWVKGSVAQGAKIEIGFENIGNQCLTPAIITNVTPQMKIFGSEVFGPTLNILRYDNLQEPIDAINNNDFCFQDAIFTQDIDVAMHYAKSISSKAVMINEGTAFRVDWMPFGGTKDSGLGFGGVIHSIEDMMEEKMIMINN